MRAFVGTLNGASESFAVATKFEHVAKWVDLYMLVVSGYADGSIFVRDHVQAVTTLNELVGTLRQFLLEIVEKPVELGGSLFNNGWIRQIRYISVSRVDGKFI